MENKQKNNPQIENGFIQIATGKDDNDILTALIRANLNGTEYQIVLLVLRKTWGYKKKDDYISLTQLAYYTGKTRRAIIKCTKTLENKSILVRKHTIGKMSSYSFNKVFTTWKGLRNKKTLVNKSAQTREQKFTQLGNESIPTKETLTKENITKESINGILPFFKDVNPSYTRLFAIPAQRAALSRLIDKYGVEWVTGVIKKLPEITSRPYAPRITTPYELEMKLGQLKVFLQQEKSKATRTGSVKV